MKKFLKLLMIFGATAMLGELAFAGGGGAQGVPFTKVIYLSATGKTANSGSSYDAAKPCQVGTGALASGTSSADLWKIPAQTLVTRAYLQIDTAITSITNLDIGDDDQSDGFIDGSRSVTLGSTGVYGWGSKNAGTYLQAVSNNASVAEAKFYAGSAGASNKTVKMSYTAGGCGAGKARIFIEGILLGVKPTI